MNSPSTRYSDSGTPSGRVTTACFAENEPDRVVTRTSPVPPFPYSMRLTGFAPRSYVIETASNLVTWLPLFTITNVSGMVQFTVTNAPPLKARFYRARVAP